MRKSTGRLNSPEYPWFWVRTARGLYTRWWGRVKWCCILQLKYNVWKQISMQDNICASQDLSKKPRHTQRGDWDFACGGFFAQDLKHLINYMAESILFWSPRYFCFQSHHGPILTRGPTSHICIPFLFQSHHGPILTQRTTWMIMFIFITFNPTMVRF